MIYKDFIAEASEKIMAAGFPAVQEENANEEDPRLRKEAISELAENSVRAAYMLADYLEEYWNRNVADGGQHRYSEKETFFDNYVNWTKNV